MWVRNLCLQPTPPGRSPPATRWSQLMQRQLLTARVTLPVTGVKCYRQEPICATGCLHKGTEWLPGTVWKYLPPSFISNFTSERRSCLHLPSGTGLRTTSGMHITVWEPLLYTKGLTKGFSGCHTAAGKAPHPALYHEMMKTLQSSCTTVCKTSYLVNNHLNLP